MLLFRHYKAVLYLSVLILLPAPFYAAKLVIKGSDTLGAKFVPQLAEIFNAQRAGDAQDRVSVEIAAEGSATGIASVLDGTADIAMLSRNLRLDEITEAESRGLKLKTIEVARDAIVVIVNSENPISQLQLRELEGIFTGDIRNWAALSNLPEPISAYTRNSSSGSYVAFQQLAMSSRDYGNRIQRMASNEQIAHEVSGNTGSIGYVSLANANSPGVRALAVNGIAPTNLEYPLSRPLYFLIDARKESELRDRFIQTALSEKGQALATELEFFANKEMQP